MSFTNNTKADLSLKKLLGVEFTSGSKIPAVETFVAGLDINQDEIYTEAVDSTPGTAVSDGVAKYFSEAIGSLGTTGFPMQPDPVVSQNAFFVCSGSTYDPENDGFDVTKVQRNFLSPKYGAGYRVQIYNSAGSPINETSTINWIFDYKTGILTVENTSAPDHDTSGYRIRAYQYVGKTLTTSLIESAGNSGIFTATGSTFSTSVGPLEVSASLTVVDKDATPVNVDFIGATGGVSGSFSGSFEGLHSGIFSGINITASGNANIGGNVEVGGNLTVIGDVNMQSSTNVVIDDQFVFIGSGSSNTEGGVDGGIIVEGTTVDEGFAFFYDASTKRWALSSGSAANTSAETPDAFLVTTTISSADPVDTSAPIYGVNENKSGQLHVNESNGNIWIYTEAAG